MTAARYRGASVASRAKAIAGTVLRLPVAAGVFLALCAQPPAVRADSSSPLLAAYYDRQMAIVDGTAYGWENGDAPVAVIGNARQVGVGRRAYYVLTNDGVLRRFLRPGGPAETVAPGVAAFSAGRSGVMTIRRDSSLWWRPAGDRSARKIADAAIHAAVGDGANYYVAPGGGLYVRGAAHRGQYGDGRLRETDDFVRTATGVASVHAHTGHALYLGRDGKAMGTGGNIYGPVGRHGLGDKAVRWSFLLSGAVGVATGSSHSHAILKDGALVGWGREYGPDPVRIMTDVRAVAAGGSVSLALKKDGTLWQWNRRDRTPRKVRLP